MIAPLFQVSRLLLCIPAGPVAQHSLVLVHFATAALTSLSPQPLLSAHLCLPLQECSRA